MITTTPVLLVHGFASSSEASWERFGWIDALESRGRMVMAPDLPGHGRAEKPTDPNDYGVIEDFVYECAQEFAPIDAVGFSLGGRLLLSVAADHSGTFRRLVIGGVGANIFTHRSPEYLAGAIESRDHERAPDSPMTEALVRGAYRSSNNAEALVAFLRRPTRRRITPEDLTRVQCPILLVVGEDDTMTSPIEALAERLANVSVKVIPSADHLVTMRSSQFLTSALSFLGRP
jgi:pimeloyl-ACP methyl ester carboxylesterase